MPMPRKYPDIAHLPKEEYAKEAARRKSKAWRKANPGWSAANEARRTRVYKGPAYHRQRKYGISPEQYDRMVEDQEGKCLICEEAKPLVVDHCHGSGKVRGLLCHHCNTGIGMLQDNPAVLQRAISYLERSRAGEDLRGAGEDP